MQILKYAVNGRDLFLHFDSRNKVKITAKEIKNRYKVCDIKTFANRVFLYGFKQMIDDIVDNSVNFELPLFGKRKASIVIEPISGEELQRNRQYGKYKDIDLLASGFTAYQIYFTWLAKDHVARKIEVYLDSKLKKRFLDRINSGQQMLSVKTTTIENYIEAIQNKWQGLLYEDVHEILQWGFRELYRVLARKCIFVARSQGVDRKFFVYIGKNVSGKNSKEWRYLRKRAQIKIRYQSLWLNPTWDGYYYLGLAEDDYNKYMASGENVRVKERTILHKLRKEAEFQPIIKYLYRYKAKENVGFLMFVEGGLWSKDLELIGVRDPNTGKIVSPNEKGRN